MSYAPATLLALRSYLIGNGAPVVGIVGDANHKGGYHLGKDRLRATDYSIRQARDKAGATNAAAAIDIGRHTGLIELGRYLHAQRNTQLAYDVRELIAERGDGSHVWRWDDVSDKTTGSVGSNELYHHLHVSYYRDSEQRDKRPLYAAHYAPPAEEDMIYSVTGVDGPFPCTVKAGTAYRYQQEGADIGTIVDGSQPFTCIGETEDRQWRYIYGRTQADAPHSRIAMVPATAVVR